MDIITIKTFHDPVSAELARMHLEEAGIPCFLADQMAASMPSVFGATVGIRLQVMEADVDTALAVLSRADEPSADENRETEPDITDAGAPANEHSHPDTPPAPTVRAPGRHDLPGPGHRTDQCPECGSHRLDRERITTPLRVLMTLLLLGLPLLFLPPRVTCRRCGRVFE